MDSIKSGLDKILSNIEVQALVQTMNDVCEVEGTANKEPLSHEEALNKACEVLKDCNVEEFSMYIHCIDKFGPIMTEATRVYMESRFNFVDEEVFNEV